MICKTMKQRGKILNLNVICWPAFKEVYRIHEALVLGKFT